MADEKLRFKHFIFIDFVEGYAVHYSKFVILNSSLHLKYFTQPYNIFLKTIFKKNYIYKRYIWDCSLAKLAKLKSKFSNY
jgi:hypothetical protein